MNGQVLILLYHELAKWKEKWFMSVPSNDIKRIYMYVYIYLLKWFCFWNFYYDVNQNLRILQFIVAWISFTKE